MRSSDSQSGIFFALRPYRLADASLSQRENGRTSAIVTGGPLRLSQVQTLKSMVAMLLRPLPYGLLLFLAGVAMVGLASVVVRRSPAFQIWNRVPPWAPVALVSGLSLFAFATTAFLIRGPGQGVPHVPDELAYIFQARVLADGRFSAPSPPVLDAFLISHPSPILVHNGRWAGMYPPVHPMVLALGVPFGSMWLIPPLFAAGSVSLLFAAARRMYGTATALLATALFAISPFFLMTGSNFMSHNTAAFFLLLALYFLARSNERLVFAAATGAGIGLLFATRPLTGLSVVPAFGLLLLLGPIELRHRQARLRQLACVCAGGLVVLTGYLLYQAMATGDPLLIYAAQGGSDALGFGGSHTLAVGLTNQLAQLSLLLLVFQNWTPALGLLLPLLPFLFGSRNRWDWFLLVAAGTLAAAYVLYYVSAIMHGPRYWYETAPLLALLSARGVTVAADRLADAGARLVAAVRLRAASPAPSAYPLVAVPVLLLALHGSYSWLFGKGFPVGAEKVPINAAALEGFNGVDNRFTSMLQAANLRNALVVVDPCAYWQCYGMAFWLNEPSLDGAVVYARNVVERPDLMMDLFAVYSGRRVYRANASEVTLTPFYQAGQASIPMEPPPAETIVLAGARDGPRGINPAGRDAIRLRDLETVRELLLRYRDKFGKYPETEIPQTLCRYPVDAGCALGEFGAVPDDPDQTRNYAYWSDGETYAVAADVEELPGTCMSIAPFELRDRTVCVTDIRSAPEGAGTHAAGTPSIARPP